MVEGWPQEKQPYNIGMADDGCLHSPDCGNRWKDPGGVVIESCTILTTEANALLKDIHDRMPVILQHADYDLWFDPGVTDPARVPICSSRSMRSPCGSPPVSPPVSKVGNDRPECAEESVAVQDGPTQSSLF